MKRILNNPTQVGKHLDTLAKKFDMESLCTQCGNCCHASVMVNKAKVMIPELPCRFLEKSNGKYSCSVYEERFKKAPWCMDLFGGMLEGTYPVDCVYTKALPGYDGSTRLSPREYEYLRPELQKAIRDSDYAEEIRKCFKTEDYARFLTDNAEDAEELTKAISGLGALAKFKAPAQPAPAPAPAEKAHDDASHYEHLQNLAESHNGEGSTPGTNWIDRHTNDLHPKEHEVLKALSLFSMGGPFLKKIHNPQGSYAMGVSNVVGSTAYGPNLYREGHVPTPGEAPLEHGGWDTPEGVNGTHETYNFKATQEDYPRSQEIVHGLASRPYDGNSPEIHRGTTLDPSVFESLKPGHSFGLGKAVSFSEDPLVADEFAHERNRDKGYAEVPVVFRVHQPKYGTSITKTSNFPKEKEVLSGGQVQIQGVNQHPKSGHHIIDVTHLPQEIVKGKDPERVHPDVEKHIQDALKESHAPQKHKDKWKKQRDEAQKRKKQLHTVGHKPGGGEIYHTDSYYGSKFRKALAAQKLTHKPFAKQFYPDLKPAETDYSAHVRKLSSEVRYTAPNQKGEHYYPKPFSELSSHEQDVIHAVNLFTAGNWDGVRHPEQTVSGHPHWKNPHDADGISFTSITDPSRQNLRSSEVLTPGSTEAYEKAHHILRHLARAPYQDEKPLFRGMKISPQASEALGEGKHFDMGPMTSWSTDYDTANSFAGRSHKEDGISGGVRYAARRSTIFSLEKPMYGTHIEKVNSFGSAEKEAVSGGRLRILRVSRSLGGPDVVHVAHIPHEEDPINKAVEDHRLPEHIEQELHNEFAKRHNPDRQQEKKLHVVGHKPGGGKIQHEDKYYGEKLKKAIIIPGQPERKQGDVDYLKHFKSLASDHWQASNFDNYMNRKLSDVTSHEMSVLKSVLLYTHGKPHLPMVHDPPSGGVSHQWAGQAGGGVNFLRESHSPGDEPLHDPFRFHPTSQDYQRAHKILSHLAGLPHEEGMPLLHRGLSLPLSHLQKMQRGIGAGFSLGPFAGFSDKWSVATHFSEDSSDETGHPPVIFTLHNPSRGTNIRKLSDVPSENEIMTGGFVRIHDVKPGLPEGGGRDFATPWEVQLAHHEGKVSRPPQSARAMSTRSPTFNPTLLGKGMSDELQLVDLDVEQAIQDAMKNRQPPKKKRRKPKVVGHTPGGGEVHHNQEYYGKDFEKAIRPLTHRALGEALAPTKKLPVDYSEVARKLSGEVQRNEESQVNYMPKKHSELSEHEQKLMHAVSAHTTGSSERVRWPTRKSKWMGPRGRGIHYVHEDRESSDLPTKRLERKFTGEKGYIQRRHEFEDSHYQDAHQITKQLAAAPYKEGKPLYRGMTLDHEVATGLQEGSHFDMGNISSWTTNKQKTNDFTYKHLKSIDPKKATRAVIFHLKEPKYGTPIDRLGHHGHEEETLTGGRVKINKVERGENYDHVHVEHMDPEELHKGRLPSHVEEALQEEFAKRHNPARRRPKDEDLEEALKDINKLLEKK